MDANEINRAVAEKVMGWHLAQTATIKGDVWITGDGQLTGFHRNTRSSCYWNPYGKWAHFGLVLERVIEHNGFIDIAISQRQGVWSGFVKLDWTHEGTAGNPLEAACLAILEAWNG